MTVNAADLSFYSETLMKNETLNGEYEMTEEMRQWEGMKPVGREIL